MTGNLDTLVVGFDLGDGETAVSVVPARGNIGPSVVRLTGAQGNGQQHVTVVGEHPERGVLVGVFALARASEMRSLYITFKRPQIDDPEFRVPALMLVNAIREDITETGAVSDTGPRRWVFGAPSGWSADLRVRYAGLLREAGLDEPEVVVDVVPESRAAMLYSREAGELSGWGGLQRGSALIIDVGSSTTDYTLVRGHKMQPADHGSPLGARIIERTILDRVLATPEGQVLEELMQENRQLRPVLEMACRRLKEDYFRSDQDRAGEPGFGVYSTDRIHHRRGSQLLTLEMTADEMAAVLATPQHDLGWLSWPEAFRADLEGIAARQTPEVIVLTGGASRMWFIRPTVAEIFPGSRIVAGTEPEVAIARGLALAGRISIRASGFRADVRALNTSGAVEAIVAAQLPVLAEQIGAAASDGMTERHVIPAFRRWRNGDITTLSDMADEVAESLRLELTAPGNPKIDQIVIDWQNGLTPEIDDLTRPICARWHIPAEAMALPVLEVSADPGDMNLRPDVTQGTALLRALATGISNVILAVIGMMLVSSTSAIILATGPVGILVALMAASVGLLIGKEAALEKAKTANLPLTLRQLRSEEKLVEKLRAEAPEKEQELATMLATQFLADGGPKLLAEISRGIGDRLEAQAVEAELLIS
jgi:hypothetical protein